jgi:hypothetical protein
VLTKVFMYVHFTLGGSYSSVLIFLTDAGVNLGVAVDLLLSQCYLYVADETR